MKSNWVLLLYKLNNYLSKIYFIRSLMKIIIFYLSNLENIIGRKAYNSRNNLFYDYDERAIYISGCNLIITDFNNYND